MTDSGELFDDLPQGSGPMAAAVVEPKAAARPRVVRPNREQIELRPMDRCRPVTRRGWCGPGSSGRI
jgi:hypothetical protein